MKKENFETLKAIEEKTNVMSRSFQGKALLRNINSVDWKQLNKICEEETGHKMGSCSGCFSDNLRRLKRLAELYYQHMKNAKEEEENVSNEPSNTEEEKPEKKKRNNKK